MLELVYFQRKQRPSLTKVDNTGGKSVAFNVGQHQEEEEVITFGDDDDDVKRKVKLIFFYMFTYLAIKYPSFNENFIKLIKWMLVICLSGTARCWDT